jgi:hypothetical protein
MIHSIEKEPVDGNPEALLGEAIRIRTDRYYPQHPTYMSILIFYFFHECYFSLHEINGAWSYLRQATKLAQLFGMTDTEIYQADGKTSAVRDLYWLLYIAERYTFGV